MSWKPEVKVVNDEKWYGNALRFKTEDEAKRNAVDLSYRWTAVVDTRATESEDPVKHIYTKEGKLIEWREGQF